LGTRRPALLALCLQRARLGHAFRRPLTKREFEDWRSQFATSNSVVSYNDLVSPTNRNLLHFVGTAAVAGWPSAAQNGRLILRMQKCLGWVLLSIRVGQECPTCEKVARRRLIDRGL
jgi:hypothetical protein